jgi:polysaccharide export outer membrane protein
MKAAQFIRSVTVVASSLGMLASCKPAPIYPGDASAVRYQSLTAVISSHTEALPPDAMRQVADETVGGSYVLGPTDVISVTVYMHPELDVPVIGNSSNTNGALITGDGATQLPLIGSINLAGMTLQEAGDALTQAYSHYIVKPKVAVQLQNAQSMRYYLLGSFTLPGVKYPERQLDLLDALALGGSVDTNNADLRQAYVAHGHVKLPVDLYALLIEGDLTQNIQLASGDAIVVPAAASENAFVFGAITKPGAVPFTGSGLTLLQALSEAGMDLSSLTNGELSDVHIIRGNGSTAQFIVVNANLIANGQAPSFVLQPGDIVFLPPTQIATWNQALDELLPSLQTVSAILNPFVSIKYLRQRN